MTPLAPFVMFDLVRYTHYTYQRRPSFLQVPNKCRDAAMFVQAG